MTQNKNPFQKKFASLAARAEFKKGVYFSSFFLLIPKSFDLHIMYTPFCLPDA
jgi:hypothetical protein